MTLDILHEELNTLCKNLCDELNIENKNIICFKSYDSIHIPYVYKVNFFVINNNSYEMLFCINDKGIELNENNKKHIVTEKVEGFINKIKEKIININNYRLSYTEKQMKMEKKEKHENIRNMFFVAADILLLTSTIIIFILSLFNIVSLVYNTIPFGIIFVLTLIQYAQKYKIPRDNNFRKIFQLMAATILIISGILSYIFIFASLFINIPNEYIEIPASIFLITISVCSYYIFTLSLNIGEKNEN